MKKQLYFYLLILNVFFVINGATQKTPPAPENKWTTTPQSILQNKDEDQSQSFSTQFLNALLTSLAISGMAVAAGGIIGVSAAGIKHLYDKHVEKKGQTPPPQSTTPNTPKKPKTPFRK